MNIFDFDEQLVKSYSDFSKSFTLIASDKIKSFLDSERSKYTPSALIQINPNYKQNLNEDVQSLVNKDILHPKCRRIFATDSNEPLKLLYMISPYLWKIVLIIIFCVMPRRFVKKIMCYIGH